LNNEAYDVGDIRKVPS